MTRSVELRPAAERDLDRVATFLAKLDRRASERRVAWLRTSLRKLGPNPFMGRPTLHPDIREFTFTYGKSSYLIRYQVTEDAVLILRIWHGKEDRSR